MMSKDGKSNLNLTDRDMQLLSEAAIAIGLRRKERANTENAEAKSYYEDCETSKRYPDSIFVYDFETAREFSRMLKNMWDYQGKTDMNEIVPNCVASTYKYLDSKPKERKKTEISPFIYEF